MGRGAVWALASAAAMAALAGCDLFDVDGTGSVSVRAPEAPFAGGVATIVADYALDAEVDGWSPSYRVDGGDSRLPEFAVDEATGESILAMSVDTVALGAGTHTIEVSLYVDGATVTDSTTFEITEGVVLRKVSLGNVGYDGDYGGSPEPEVHLFDAAGEWIGCAPASDGVAIRGGDGSPLSMAPLAGRAVTVMVIENDSANGCEPPAFTSDLFGDGDDFLGQSDVFALSGDVTVEAGAGNQIEIAFGVGT